MTEYEKMLNGAVLDGAYVTIGDNVLIGPNVQLYTSAHSMDSLSRRRWQTFCKPIVL
jgi:maltose O-acetyltransferase